MRKKTTRAAVKKTTPRAPRRASTPKQTILFRRIVIISACVVLVAVTGVLVNKQSITQSVAGASIMKGLFMQASVLLPTDSQAISYNIYYKEAGDKEFLNAVRDIPASVHTYTISHLKKGGVYEYRVASVDTSGKEYSFSEIQPLTDLQPM